MKPVDVRSHIYIDFRKKLNDKNSKFKIDYTVRKLK